MTAATTHTDHTAHFARFKEVLNALDCDHMDLVDEVYAPTMVFQDPVHMLEGRAAFRAYLERLYANVTHCHFRIRNEALQGNTAFVAWTMEMRHARFRKHETLYLDGMSMAVFASDGMIAVHHDSFDLGAMLYERLPILGAITKRIKRAL